MVASPFSVDSCGWILLYMVTLFGEIFAQQRLKIILNCAALVLATAAACPVRPAASYCEQQFSRTRAQSFISNTFHRFMIPL
jgi:hypothetical protein